MNRRWQVMAFPMFVLAGCDLPGTQASSVESAAVPAVAAAAPVGRSPASSLRAAPDATIAGEVSTASVEGSPPFVATEFARFDQPWAMTFLPDGRLLVTEKPGSLRLFNPETRAKSEVVGLPAVAYGGQGGLGDVVLHPQYAANGLVYISYAESGTGGFGGAVIRAQLVLNSSGNGGSLSGAQVVWRQSPKVGGQGHYSHRMAFDSAGKLWITSGDRQQATPAQNMQQNLGKVVRLNDDGSIPADNPFASQGGVAAQVWSLGHRNPLGIAIDGAGRLWTHEMGPEGGDELNLIERGNNYGWPNVSNGSNYGGGDIPDHNPVVDGYNAPEAWWTPVIAPAGFVIYSGNLFPNFRGQGFVGGLASQSLVRIRFNGMRAREYRRYPMGARIREIEQGPDGALWVLDDGSNARLRKLTPAPYVPAMGVSRKPR